MPRPSLPESKWQILVGPLGDYFIQENRALHLHNTNEIAARDAEIRFLRSRLMETTENLEVSRRLTMHMQHLNDFANGEIRTQRLKRAFLLRLLRNVNMKFSRLYAVARANGVQMQSGPVRDSIITAFNLSDPEDTTDEEELEPIEEE